MNVDEIAHKILNRRNSQSPVILVGEMQQALGSDGYAFALEHRWLEPDYHSGGLNITQHEAGLQEMRKLAANVSAKPVTESAPRGVQRLFVNSKTSTYTVTPGGIYESQDAEIGDEVTVAEDGKPFTAVVKSRNNDGTYVLSFGSDKPRTERPYKSDEIKKSDKSPAATGSAPKPPAVAPQRP